MFMFKSEKFRVGIAGAGGRPSGFKDALEAVPEIEVAAVCDTAEEKAREAAMHFAGAAMYTDYETMLDKAGLDAVIVGTPMHMHVPQSLMALERNIHVVSEVAAGVTIGECRELVRATRASKAQYAMAENCNYRKELMIVGQMIQSGEFGDVYFAEGEYLHEVKALNGPNMWRRRWHSGVNGITYGTHCLGPVLDWLEGDRIVSVSCMGSGHHYMDSQGRPYEQEDTCLMLAKTAAGKLVKVRLDMLSERPYALNYSLQGTKGGYESDRFGGTGKIWTSGRSGGHEHWTEIGQVADEFVPDLWRNIPPHIEQSGHGGTDYVMMLDFMQALLEGRPVPIGIDRAMDMTLPGLVSQLSIANGGEWLGVPDSRDW